MSGMGFFLSELEKQHTLNQINLVAVPPHRSLHLRAYVCGAIVVLKRFCVARVEVVLRLHRLQKHACG
jgi:hypothetical protein